MKWPMFFVSALLGAYFLSGCSSQDGNTGPDESDKGIVFKETSGPLGGEVFCLAHNLQGSVYAGVFSRGVFVSTDGGASWTERSSGLSDMRVFSLATVANDTIYAGTNYGGVFRSSNSGKSWISIGLSSQWIRCLFVDEKGRLHAGADGVYWLTADRLNWALLGLSTTSVHSFCTNASGILFAGTNNQGIYMASANGLTWTPAGLQGYYILALAKDPGGVLLAGTLGRGVFKSLDQGATWRAAGLVNKTVSAFAITRSNHVLAATHTGIYQSRDNGATWPALGLAEFSISDLTVSNNGDIFAATGSGVYCSKDDGVHWKLETSGMKASIVWSFATVSTTLFAGVEGGGLCSTDDGGLTWVNRGLHGESQITELLVRPNGHFLAGTEHGVFRSTDGGAHWHLTSYVGHNVNTFFALPNGSILAGAHQGLFRSTDNGETWINTGTLNMPVICLARDSLGALYAGTSEAGILRSLDDGAVWMTASKGLPNAASVSAIAVRFDGCMFAFVNNSGVYRSCDNGANWQLVKSISSGFRGLVITPEGKLFLSVFGVGYIYGSENGQDWERITSGLNSLEIISLGRHSDGRLYIGTLGHGVYRSANPI